MDLIYQGQIVTIFGSNFIQGPTENSEMHPKLWQRLKFWKPLITRSRKPIEVINQGEAEFEPFVEATLTPRAKFDSFDRAESFAEATSSPRLNMGVATFDSFALVASSDIKSWLAAKVGKDDCVVTTVDGIAMLGNDVLGEIKSAPFSSATDPSDVPRPVFWLIVERPTGLTLAKAEAFSNRTGSGTSFFLSQRSVTLF